MGKFDIRTPDAASKNRLMLFVCLFIYLFIATPHMSNSPKPIVSRVSRELNAKQWETEMKTDNRFSDKTKGQALDEVNLEGNSINGICTLYSTEFGYLSAMS